MIIELPSGLRGEARKIRGSEAIELAERANDPTSNTLGGILRNCWVRTIDPGPYEDAVLKDGLDWDKVLKGDLLGGLLRLRAASIPTPGSPPEWPGARYDFYVQCESCRHRYGWTITDITQLPYRTLSAESVETMRTKKRFTASCESDTGPHELEFDLMLPEQDAVLRQMIKQLNRKRITNVESIAAQTRTIDGQVKSPAVRQRFFADLSLGEINRLRDAYDAVDCGVDIDIVTKCEECEWTQESTLPFGRTFWRPEPPKKTAAVGVAPEDQDVGPAK